MPGFWRGLSASSAAWPDGGGAGVNEGIPNPGGKDPRPAPGAAPPAGGVAAGGGELAANTLPILTHTQTHTHTHSV